MLLSHHNYKVSSDLLSTPPDAYMDGVVATILNDQGKPALKIKTPHMVHYAETNMTRLLKPNVIIFRESPKPWYVTSDYAELSHGIEQIIFQNHVVIHHPSDIANPMTTMTTASLTVFPSKQIAQTESAITIKQPDIVVNAVGMFANLQDGTIKLLSEARGEYAPNS